MSSMRLLARRNTRSTAFAYAMRVSRTGVSLVAGLAFVTLASAQERMQVPQSPGSAAGQTQMQAPPQNSTLREGRRLLTATPPANLRIEPQHPGLHKVTWDDPGAGQFRVLRRGGNSSAWTLVADSVTGTQYLDRAVVLPGTVYRVDAIYPAGMAAGTEVVYQNPPRVDFPREFRGWQDPTEKVTLRWIAAPNVMSYRLFGPTLPQGGASVKMSPDSTPAGGYAVNYGIYSLPPGTHTFSITSEYGDGVYLLDGMPLTTLTATARRSRYRITVNGFRANAATNDDPIQHRDGKGDEIFVAVFVGSDLARIDRKIVRSRVYGDVNHFPDRIQAGSSSPYGGIGPGNVVPPTAGAALLPVSAMPDRLPLLVWEGELWDGDRGLAVVPTVWEWDGDDKNYRMWSGWLMGDRYDWRDVMIREMKPEPIRVYGIGPKLGPDTFGVYIDDSFGKDLPIGYSNFGMISFSSSAKPSFSSRAFMMSRGSIERSLGSHQTVVLPINWTGSGGVGGAYDLFLQVERLP